MRISDVAGAGVRQDNHIKPVINLSMKRQLLNLLITSCLASTAFAQYNSAKEQWRGELHRTDGIDIVFTFNIQTTEGKKLMYITNGSERIKVEDIRFRDDSVFIEMPTFESSFKARVSKDSWTGMWNKGTAGAMQHIPFSATHNLPRFESKLNPRYNISGRWAVNFSNDHQQKASSLAEFVQRGDKLTGTFLTATGDYRYQEGIVSGDKFMLSGFDGAHAFLFTGKLTDARTITDAMYYSGASYKEGWTAIKDPNAKVSTDPAAMFLKPGEEKLDFKFPDLNGNTVSINDERFKGKVVIVQLMGSWCPNCMDETAFLSNYYNHNRSRGVEVVSLAYEYSTDFSRSVNSLNKFRERFKVTYPMLITGVTVKDSLRTQKTLPQVTDIKVFPSSIILDKKGKVRFLETDFFGQGTGEHFVSYTKKFTTLINELLAEK